MSKLLALVMMTSAAAGQNSSGAAPIYVASEPVAGGIRFQVIAEPRERFEGSFSLEVTSDGNHSRHQGTANLGSGQRAILSTVTVGVQPRTEWRARLRVEPTGAAAYEQVLASE